MHPPRTLAPCCCRRIAKAEQVELSYIQRRCGGVRGDPLVEARHARFAAAMLLDLLVDDASCVMHVEKTWGKPDSLTKMGKLRAATLDCMAAGDTGSSTFTNSKPRS